MGVLGSESAREPPVCRKVERMGFALKAPSGAFIQEQRREALRLSTHDLLRAADLANWHEESGADGIRTHDLLRARQALSQLSYRPITSGAQIYSDHRVSSIARAQAA